MNLKNRDGYINEFLTLTVLLVLVGGVLAVIPFKWARLLGVLVVSCAVICAILSWVYDPKRIVKKLEEEEAHGNNNRSQKPPD